MSNVTTLEMLQKTLFRMFMRVQEANMKIVMEPLNSYKTLRAKHLAILRNFQLWFEFMCVSDHGSKI